MYSYDSHGWLTAAEIPGRTTGKEPPAHGAKTVGQPYPNFTGVEWVMVNYVAPVLPVYVAPKPTLTHRQFLSRFTTIEFKAIRQAAKTDADVDLFMYLFEKASEVNLNDADTIAGVNMLASKLIISAARAAEILA